jgi:hypothetical protein
MASHYSTLIRATVRERSRTKTLDIQVVIPVSRSGIRPSVWMTRLAPPLCEPTVSYFVLEAVP